jgi:hypothetical protein
MNGRYLAISIFRGGFMKNRKIFLCMVLALPLGLTAHPGLAAVVTSIPGGTIIPISGVNYSGSGPQTFGPGITWTSTYSDSNFGLSGGYGFSGNGYWTGSIGPMAGLNDSTDAHGVTNTMTFAFSTPVSAVGGFLNYIPGSTNPTTIAVYDASNHLIESFNLTFTTGGGDDTGFFYGFEEPANIISYFTLTDNYVGIVNLTTETSPVPLPGAIWLLGSGLLGLAGLRKRFRGRRGGTTVGGGPTPARL